MEKKPKLNVALLRKVDKHISAVPERFYMGDFGHKTDSAGGETVGEVEPVCNTQACIGGWGVFLSHGMTKRTWHKLLDDQDFDFEVEARKLLGLTRDEAKSLFYWGTCALPGPDLVQEGHERIQLLIKDRKKFVETYPYRR